MRLCFIGDSFVVGHGDPEYLGWVGRLCASARADRHDVTAYNLGVRGNTSADVLSRWQAESSRRFPDGQQSGLVFSFGVNDTIIREGRQRVSLEDSVENARQIIEKAGRQAPTIFIGPPPIADAAQNARIKDLGETYDALCEGLEVLHFNPYAALAASDLWMGEVAAGDGAHPSAAGYAMFAGLIRESLDWRAFLKGVESSIYL